MFERRVAVINRLGLHARAAAKVVNTARTFESSIKLRKGDGPEADARSILDILAMSATCGSEIALVAEGKDEEAAIESMARLFADGFGEGSQIVPE